MPVGGEDRFCAAAVPFTAGRTAALHHSLPAGITYHYLLFGCVVVALRGRFGALRLGGGRFSVTPPVYCAAIFCMARKTCGALPTCLQRIFCYKTCNAPCCRCLAFSALFSLSNDIPHAFRAVPSSPLLMRNACMLLYWYARGICLGLPAYWRAGGNTAAYHACWRARACSLGTDVHLSAAYHPRGLCRATAVCAVLLPRALLLARGSVPSCDCACMLAAALRSLCYDIARCHRLPRRALKHRWIFTFASRARTTRARVVALKRKTTR